MPVLGYSLQSPTAANAALVGTYGETDQPCRYALTDVVAQASYGPVVSVASSTARNASRYTYQCDGVDDQVQIQQAIDAPGSAGGAVVLSEGIFTLANAGTASGSGLNIPYAVKVLETAGPIVIRGQGTATTVKLANNQPIDTALICVRGTSDASRRTAATVIRDMQIDGNQTGQPQSWALSGLIFTAYCDDVTVQSCYVHDSKFLGVYILRNTKLIRVLDCRIVNGVNSGLRIETPMGSVRGNWFQSVTANLFASLACVVNNDVATKSEYLSILGNVFDGGGQQATLGGTQHSVLSGNIFRDCLNASGVALKIEANTANDVLGNVVSGNAFYNIRQGIQLSPNGSFNALRNIIIGNSIEEGPDISLINGVIESGGANYNLVTNNIIQGATTPITLVGASSVQANNITV